MAFPASTTPLESSSSASTRLSADRRRELGTFLRSRRERLTCADVGLPQAARRRTPGLRREELAMLAGISTTWLTYLEQGRQVQASRQVLAALATALRLGPAERAHLFDLASHAPAPSDAAAVPVSGTVAGVVTALEPHPAYVLADDFEVLVWNAAAAQLVPTLLGEGREDVRPNLARWLLCDPTAREVFPEWESVAQDVLARLRAAAGRHPGDRRYADLVAQLRAASPEADAWWPRYDVRAGHSGRKRVRHPVRGLVDLAHASFAVADHPEQTLVVYLDEVP